MALGRFLKRISGFTAVKKFLNRDRDYAAGREDTRIQRTVQDARLAGIHPLFALGGATGSSSTYPSTGSQVGTALNYLQGRSRLKADKARGQQSSLVDSSLIKQATANTRLANSRADTVEWELKNSIRKRAEGTANSQQDFVAPDVFDPLQELKPGQVDPHFKKNREQSLNIKSIMSRIRIGDQDVWLPIDEIDEFFENPLAIGAAVFAYHGNKNVNWPKLFRDYTGKKSLKQTMKENIKKNIPVTVRKNHLLKQYAKPIQQMEMP